MVTVFCMRDRHESLRADCGRQNNAPATPDFYIQIPRTCEYTILHGKKDSTCQDVLQDPDVGRFSRILPVGSL